MCARYPDEVFGSWAGEWWFSGSIVRERKDGALWERKLGDRVSWMLMDANEMCLREIDCALHDHGDGSENDDDGGCVCDD